MLLQEIFDKVKGENARSKTKYGLWRGNYDDSEQKEAIVGEYEEWKRAYSDCDIHSDHGEIAELHQLINVACRRIQFLSGEPDA